VVLVNHVVGAVGLLDALQVEPSAGDVGEAERLGPLRRDGSHLRRHVREHDLAARGDPLRRRQPGTAGSARQLEHALAWLGQRGLEHPPGHVRVAGVHELRLLGP
jgi:hypothetical protein